MHFQSANDLRQPTLINTFGQDRAPIRSFQTAIKEESNAEQHFVTFWITYYYINIYHCKKSKSHSTVAGSDLNARRLYSQSDQPTLAMDSWVSTLGYLYWIKRPTWRTILFYVFISILYTFRTTSCSSSGESTVSIQHLVCVTLCRDVVLIQLILLMMSTMLLETYRELK
jgi:hypothetical protein